MGLAALLSRLLALFPLRPSNKESRKIPSRSKAGSFGPGGTVAANGAVRPGLLV